MKEMKHRWLFLTIIASVGFFIDWFTKYLAEIKLQRGVPFEIAGDFFQFLLVYNTKAVFGLDPGAVIPGFPLNTFFFVFTIIAIGLLLLYYWRLDKEDRIMHVGLAMILPGALGNLFDRVIHPGKGVVDFIKVGISDTLYWPIFNMADVYVTLGVIIIISSVVFEYKRAKKKEERTKEIF